MQTDPNQFSYLLGQATSPMQEAYYPEHLRRLVELLRNSHQGLTAVLAACRSADPVVRLKLLHILHVILPHMYQASLGQLSTADLTAPVNPQSTLPALVKAYTEYLQTRAFNQWHSPEATLGPNNLVPRTQGLFKQLTLLDRVIRLCGGPPVTLFIGRTVLAQLLQDIRPDMTRLSTCLNAFASMQTTGPALVQFAQQFEALKKALSESYQAASVMLTASSRPQRASSPQPTTQPTPQPTRQTSIQRIMGAFSASPASLFQQGNVKGLPRPPQQ